MPAVAVCQEAFYIFDCPPSCPVAQSGRHAATAHITAMAFLIGLGQESAPSCVVLCSLTKATVLVFDLSHQSVAFHGSLSEFLLLLLVFFSSCQDAEGKEWTTRLWGPAECPTGWLAGCAELS